MTDHAPGEPVPVDLRDYVVFDLAGATGRRVLATDVLALDLLCLEPSQAVEARTFDTADAVYTVLGGRAWVVTDDAEVTLGPLQAVLVPAGVPHGIRNDSADPLILQAVVSPPDEAPELVTGPAPDDRAELTGEAHGGLRVDSAGARAGGQRPPGARGALERLRRVLGG